jgi:hypothetical protein
MNPQQAAYYAQYGQAAYTQPHAYAQPHAAYYAQYPGQAQVPYAGQAQLHPGPAQPAPFAQPHAAYYAQYPGQVAYAAQTSPFTLVPLATAGAAAPVTIFSAPDAAAAAEEYEEEFDGT